MTTHEADLPRLMPRPEREQDTRLPPQHRATDPKASLRDRTPSLPPGFEDTLSRHEWVGSTGASAADFVVRTAPISRGARTLHAVHSSALAPEVIFLDALTVFVAGTAAHFSIRGALIATFMLLSTCYLLQVYAERDAIQSKGIAWYAGKLLIPVGGITSAGLVFDSFDDRVAVRFAFLTLVSLLATRCVTWLVLHVMHMRGKALRRTLIVGTGRAVTTVASKLRAYPQVGLVPIGSLGVGDVLAEDGLASAIRATRTDHVILAPELGEESDLVESIRRGGGSNATFSLLPPLADLFLHPANTNELGGLPLVPLGRLLHRRENFPGKRAFDVMVGGALLVVLAPVMALVALAIKMDSRGPVLYLQDRIGRESKTFRVIKFRSMVVGADEEFDDLRKSISNVSDGLLFKHASDHRVTRLGRQLRRSALDELPQLINVLIGDMSLVGPRPLAVAAEEFDTVENQRHSVTPGMTGYWQVSGGNGLTYQEMVRLDLAYIRNWSLWLDVRLILKTIPALLNRHRPS